MTVLENLIIAQHNPLMRASGYTIAGSVPVQTRALSGADGSARVAGSRDASTCWLGLGNR